jgi:hypothetical protein
MYDAGLLILLAPVAILDFGIVIALVGEAIENIKK